MVVYLVELVNVVVYLVFKGNSHEVLELVNVVVYLVFNGHIVMSLSMF